MTLLPLLRSTTPNPLLMPLLYLPKTSAAPAHGTSSPRGLVLAHYCSAAYGHHLPSRGCLPGSTLFTLHNPAEAGGSNDQRVRI